MYANEISMEKYVVGLDVRKEFRRGRTSITRSSRLLHSLKIRSRCRKYLHWSHNLHIILFTRGVWIDCWRNRENARNAKCDLIKFVFGYKRDYFGYKKLLIIYQQNVENLYYADKTWKKTWRQFFRFCFTWTLHLTWKTKWEEDWLCIEDKIEKHST